MTNNKKNTENLGEKIVLELKSIFDPEIPVDIYELGLIYDVFVNEDNEVKIMMTLTSPNCPVAESLPQEVEEKIKSINPKGIILSGGPDSVTKSFTPRVSQIVFDLARTAADFQTLSSS